MHFDALASALIAYRYWVLIPLAIVEGPIVAFVVGALASRGHFSLSVAFAVFVVKDAAIDGVYYYLGRFAAGKPFVVRFLTKVGTSDEDLRGIRLLWTQRGWRAMFASKLSFGIAPVLLTAAGVIAVPAGMFFCYAIGVALVQYSVVLTLGFYFGHAIGAATLAIRCVQVAAGGVALATIVYIGRRVRAIPG